MPPLGIIKKYKTNMQDNKGGWKIDQMSLIEYLIKGFDNPFICEINLGSVSPSGWGISGFDRDI